MNKNRVNRTFFTKKNRNYETLINRSVFEVTKTDYLRPISQKNNKNDETLINSCF